MARLLLIAVLVCSPMFEAPAGAITVVNAATIFRLRCKQTPPERRSPKCLRLVGNR